MANVYSQMTKINNASGRSHYISNHDKQEEIVLHKQNLQYGWDFVSDFEKSKSDKDKENWEAREIIIALPNELSQDLSKLEVVADDLTTTLVGVNREHEYAIHWNEDRTNLHMHLLFSERERAEALRPKKYKRDMWYDKTTNRMAKANAENAELRYKKGDIMKDKEGNVRYDHDPLMAKDPKFKSQAFLREQRELVQAVLKDHGFELGVQDYDTPFLSQRKEHKGAREDYLANVRAYNREVRAYNEQVATHLQLDPNQEDTYKEIRQDLESEIRFENGRAKTWSEQAAAVVQNMREFVTELVLEIRNKAKALIGQNKLANWWEENKEEFIDLFQEKESLALEQERIHDFVDTADRIIEDQKDQVQEISQDRSDDHDFSL